MCIYLQYELRLNARIAKLFVPLIVANSLTKSETKQVTNKKREHVVLSRSTPASISRIFLNHLQWMGDQMPSGNIKCAMIAGTHSS